MSSGETLRREMKGFLDNWELVFAFVMHCHTTEDLLWLLKSRISGKCRATHGQCLVSDILKCLKCGPCTCLFSFPDCLVYKDVLSHSLIHHI